jgi:hypothetical protein
VELLLEEELQERLEQARAHLGVEPLAISAAARRNLDQLLSAVWMQLGL